MQNSEMPPPDFNPWTQPVTLLYQDGSNFTVSVEKFDDYRLYGCRVALIYGTQIGASVLLLLVLLLLTKAEKRKTFVFITNVLCLSTNIVRIVLLALFLTGNFWNPYTELAYDFRRVTTSDIATRVAGEVMTLLLTLLVMISLSAQVWVVCVNTMRLQRYIIMAVTSGMACVAFGFAATAHCANIKLTLEGSGLRGIWADMLSLAYVMQAVSIWFFSCVFAYKLGYAIVRRRRLNMPQFGPMQIVFIMSCQTLIVPAIATCFEFQNTVPEFGTEVLTIVCIFLPLSAIWAGVVNDSIVASSAPDSHQHLIHGEFYRSSQTTTTSGSVTSYNKSRALSVSTYSKGKEIESALPTPSPRRESRRDDDGIHMDQEFGVLRGDAANRV